MFHKTKARQPEAVATDVVASASGHSLPPRQETSATRPSVSIIGSHTRVQGDIDADEDLTVAGYVQGTIICKQNTVTLGSGSCVNGDVYAHTLQVSGEVEGNLVASHRATIHKGANVRGMIVTPCLMLEDGSTFQGSIDMDPEHELLKSAFGEPATNRRPRSTPSLEVSDGSAAESVADEPLSAPELEDDARPEESST
ncbi:bactofilin family protein [Billgrantia desiderata]|uniref:bactofilin family protein n=1 Tax=Billgrantia desiderata TaxID=52021 RepID=UPI001F40ABAE